MAKQVLEVGQTVFLESRYRFDDKAPNLHEMVIVEANKTSAYAAQEDSPKLRHRINQRTHKLDSSTLYSYTLWLSKEDYEANKAAKAEYATLLQEAQEKVKTLNTDQLKAFLGK